MCSLPAKIAIERKVDLPNDYLKDLIPVQLSSQPNSNQALATVDGCPSAYGYLFNLTSLIKSERLTIISSEVTKLCEFLNSCVLNKNSEGLDRTYPIKPGITISKYSIPIKPNITQSPTRKLGDIIMANDAQRVLSNMFDLEEKANIICSSCFSIIRETHCLTNISNYPLKMILFSAAQRIPIQTSNGPKSSIKAILAYYVMVLFMFPFININYFLLCNAWNIACSLVIIFNLFLVVIKYTAVLLPKALAPHSSYEELIIFKRSHSPSLTWAV